MPESVRLRPAAVQDADALVPLLAELGYAVAPDVVRDNVRRLAQTEVDRVWVAERDGTVLGVVSVHLTPLFRSAGTRDASAWNLRAATTARRRIASTRAWAIACGPAAT